MRFRFFALLLLLAAPLAAQRWSDVTVVTSASGTQQIILRSADGTAPRRIAVSNLVPNAVTSASISGSTLTLTLADGTTSDLTLPSGGGGGSGDLTGIDAGTGIRIDDGDSATPEVNVDAAGVGTAQIADDAVTTAKIAGGTDGTDEYKVLILDSSANPVWTLVPTSGIENAAVTAAKIGSGAVTAAKIGSGAVTTAKIGSDAVTTAKIGGGTDGTDDDKVLRLDGSADPEWAKIEAKNIETTNSATDGQMITYDSATGGFTFEPVPSGGGGGDLTSVTSDATLTGSGTSAAPLRQTWSPMPGDRVAVADTTATTAANVDTAGEIFLSGITNTADTAVAWPATTTMTYAANSGDYDLLAILDFGDKLALQCTAGNWAVYNISATAARDTDEEYDFTLARTARYAGQYIPPGTGECHILFDSVGAPGSIDVDRLNLADDNVIVGGSLSQAGAVAIGDGLENDSTGGLRVDLDGATLTRGASGMSVTNPCTAADETKLDGIGAGADLTGIDAGTGIRIDDGATATPEVNIADDGVGFGQLALKW